jgi:hypothetical protein
MGAEGEQKTAANDGAFPSTRERVPPPASVYAFGGALLAVVLVALIVEFFVAAHHASEASQIVVGVLIVADVVAGGWLLSAAENRRRCIYEWRSDALELLARYREVAGRMPTGPARAWVRGGSTGGERAELRGLAVEAREQALLAEAALRDAGAYKDAFIVGNARRRSDLIADDEPSQPTTHESASEDAPERGPDA